LNIGTSLVLGYWDLDRDMTADKFMQTAIAEAHKSRDQGGIPIGSALVRAEELMAVGHNKRVQENDPVTHAEIDCLRNAGRIGSFHGTVLYSTLMPCYLCAGAVVQFGIRKVVVGESRTFAGATDFLRQHGVEVIDLDLPECVEMMSTFITEHPALWNEDIGR
jgi:cytosine/creatinine deaminase